MDASTGSVQGLEGVDEQLVRQLAERARAEGLKLTGKGGLLARLTKVVVESAMDGMAARQSRPLEAVYPVSFIDCGNVKSRDGSVANRPIYVALAVSVDGHRDILGVWAGEDGDGEGAKYWMRVLSEIKNRGTRD